MNRDDDDKFLKLVGENNALKLSDQFGGRRFPGKKFRNRLKCRKFLKEWNGLDAKKYAQKYDVSVTTIYNWLNMDKKPPTTNNLYKKSKRVEQKMIKKIDKRDDCKRVATFAKANERYEENSKKRKSDNYEISLEEGNAFYKIINENTFDKDFEKIKSKLHKLEKEKSKRVKANR